MPSKDGSKLAATDADKTVIRRASPDEIDCIVEMYLHVVQGKYISHGEVLDGITRDFRSQAPDLRKRKTEEFRSITSGQKTERSLLVAYQGGEMAGFLFGGIERHTSEGTPFATSIYDLGVAEPHRNQGIGTKLMQAFISWAKDKGALWVFCESGVNNERAHRLFHRLGFVLTSHVFMLPLDESLIMPAESKDICSG